MRDEPARARGDHVRVVVDGVVVSIRGAISVLERGARELAQGGARQRADVLTVASLAAARAALEQLEVADKANSRPSETVDLDEDVVARNTLAETNIARSTSRASNDSNRISIASQEDFKF